MDLQLTQKKYFNNSLLLLFNNYQTWNNLWNDASQKRRINSKYNQGLNSKIRKCNWIHRLVDGPYAEYKWHDFAWSEMSLWNRH